MSKRWCLLLRTLVYHISDFPRHRSLNCMLLGLFWALRHKYITSQNHNDAKATCSKLKHGRGVLLPPFEARLIRELGLKAANERGGLNTLADGFVLRHELFSLFDCGFNVLLYKYQVCHGGKFG
jgi:hypothetical protein